MVTCPTFTPWTSVMAFISPGEYRPMVTPRSLTCGRVSTKPWVEEGLANTAEGVHAQASPNMQKRQVFMPCLNLKKRMLPVLSVLAQLNSENAFTRLIGEMTGTSRKILSHTYGRQFLEIQVWNRLGEREYFSLPHRDDIRKWAPGSNGLGLARTHKVAERYAVGAGLDEHTHFEATKNSRFANR